MMQMVEKKPWYAGDVDVESLRARFGDFSHHLHMHDTASLALITPGANRVRMKGPKFAAWAANLYATDANKPPACWSMAKAAAGATIYTGSRQLGERLSDGGGGMGISVLRGPIIRDAAFMSVHHQCEADGPVARSPSLPGV